MNVMEWMVQQVLAPPCFEQTRASTEAVHTKGEPNQVWERKSFDNAPLS